MAADDREATDADWASLTSLEEKRAYYAPETYFRESMWDWKAVLGPRLFPVLHRVTLLIFKPESLVGRRTGAVMRFLAEHELTPIWLAPFRYSREMLREIWRYQWNAATIDKMDVAERVNCERPTLLLVLRDDAADRKLPAAVRLKQLKGAASPEVREERTLRTAIGAPNRLVTFVHAPDEPADLVRELGIFFGRPARRKLLAEVAASLDTRDVTADVLTRLEPLEAAVPAVDFEPEPAWERILALANGDARAALEAQRELFRASRKIEWEAFEALAADAGAQEWDVLTIGTAAVDYDDPAKVPFITFGSLGLDGWLQGRARFCS